MHAKNARQAVTHLALIGLMSGTVSCDFKPTTVSEQQTPARKLLRTISGEGQAEVATRALPLPLEIRVTSANGTAIRGDTVLFATESGGWFLEPGRAVTDSTGRATAVWVLGPRAGEQQARVTFATGGGAGSAVMFHATALPDDPARLELLVADSMKVSPRPSITFPLSARVVDAHGNGVPHILVRWQFPTSGTVEADSTLTDHDGTAFTRWTIASPVDSASVKDYSLTVRIDDTRAPNAAPVVINRRIGILSPREVVTGSWVAERWEFFRDSAMTELIEDVMANGMSGMLTIVPTEAGSFNWFWSERYRWWGPSHGTEIWGRLWLNRLTFYATVTGGYSDLECDWGDCDGPLHGQYDLDLVDWRLVVTGRQPASYFRAAGPMVAWSRFTLLRR